MLSPAMAEAVDAVMSDLSSKGIYCTNDGCVVTTEHEVIYVALYPPPVFPSPEALQRGVPHPHKVSRTIHVTFDGHIPIIMSPEGVTRVKEITKALSLNAAQSNVLCVIHEPVLRDIESEILSKPQEALSLIYRKVEESRQIRTEIGPPPDQTM